MSQSIIRVWTVAAIAVTAAAGVGSSEIVHIRATSDPGNFYQDDYGLLDFIGGSAPMVAEFRYDTDAAPMDGPGGHVTYAAELTFFVGGRVFVGMDATVSVLELTAGGIFQDYVDVHGTLELPDPNPPVPGLPEIVTHYIGLRMVGTGDLLPGPIAPPASVYDLSNPDLFVGSVTPRLELIYAGPTDPIGNNVTSRTSGPVVSFEMIPAPGASGMLLAIGTTMAGRRQRRRDACI